MSTRRMRAGYGVGDFALNLHWNAIGMFLIFFYTDHLGLAPAAAGATFLVASVWDALLDPLAGTLADRTRSRWGRFRPYILVGGPVLALALPLAFTDPGLTGAALTAFVLASHMLLRTAYAFVSIPYAALSARIARDPDERSRLAGVRMLFGTAATIVSAVAIPTIAAQTPGADGWTIAAGMMGMLSILGFAACVVWTREPVEVDTPPVSRGWRTELVRELSAYAAMVRASPSLRRVIAIIMLTSVALTMFSKMILYFFKYVLMAEASAPLALFLLTGGAALAIPLWVWLSIRRGKRKAWMIASWAAAANFAGFYLLGSASFTLACIFLFLVGATTSAFAVLFWSMLPDTVEESELASGSRGEAKTFGLAIFAQKTALGINGLLVGLLLPAIGFVANRPQSAESVHGIVAIMTLIPLAGVVLGMAVMRGYGLSADAHAAIRARIGGTTAP
ncbi:glycoside-pentoside-hexuronide (GPH):cation symporter [Novosphingobium aquae]|uniref:Glycoside-pentoside-hexuronide (GPH):cation symporter n=1 Tax=Novosphingobium aquae TaxID=3133435 RepID=A0ABU8SA12_9SPHN